MSPATETGMSLRDWVSGAVASIHFLNVDRIIAQSYVSVHACLYSLSTRVLNLIIYFYFQNYSHISIKSESDSITLSLQPVLYLFVDMIVSL